MRNLRKNIVGLCLVGMGLGAGASAQAATGVGPYYAMPAWDQTLPAATRFIVLTNMNSEAVLDRETGLVWEKAPSTSISSWVNAQTNCIRLSLGGRKGWRLPSIQDLASLIDPTQFNLALPSGHPFITAPPQSSIYWSATTTARDTTNAYIVAFFNGFLDSTDKSNAGLALAWCVRGGPGVDPQ